MRCVPRRWRLWSAKRSLGRSRDWIVRPERCGLAGMGGGHHEQPARCHRAAEYQDGDDDAEFVFDGVGHPVIFLRGS